MAVVGLAGVTGLALGAVGVAASPAVGAFGRTLTAADDHGGDRGRHDDTNKRDAGKGDDRGKGDGKGRGSQKPAGIPVPCDADALIAQITLANARGGAVLDLAKDCTYLLTADIDGAGLPAITAPITLNGGKKTTIERAAAVDEFRIFTVDVGGDLTLNKLTVTGGQTDGDGGGILVNAGGALTTTHSTITRNISGDSGGGIANNGTTRVNHSTVNRNTANDTNEQGGGIYSTGLLEIVKSHIDNNLSEFGGGIYSSSSTVTVKGGTISGNQAAIGGGLYVSGGIGVVTGTRIAGNSAADTGGVRVSTVGQVTLRKVALTDNTAQTVGGLGVSGPTNGGASFAVVEDSVIKNNIATEFDGGGIFNGGQTVVRNTKIIDNQADRGGGIFNSTQATTSLFSTKVIKNIAVTNGGGIFNAAGTVDLNTATGTVVIKNRPNNCVNVPGCAG